MSSSYVTEAGKVLGSIIRQKMDEYVNDNYTITAQPYSCINLVTNNNKDMNMKSWLALADAIGEYIEGYMKVDMTSTGSYVYFEQAAPPPPPPILPAMGTLSEAPTYGTVIAKSPESILNLCLPTMIFSSKPTTIQLDAIKDNLRIIAVWLNVTPTSFDQTTMNAEFTPAHSLNGMGQVIFTGAFNKYNDIAVDIVNAMNELGNEITYIEANNILATGIVNMLNEDNMIYSFDGGQIVPEATNKVPMTPGIYFGVSDGIVSFSNEYQSKVQTSMIAPPLVGTMTFEIPLPEIDLSDVVRKFIDKMFDGMDKSDEDQKEMENNFGDVLRVTFNGLFERGTVLFTKLSEKVNEFISRIMIRLSINSLVDKFIKRIHNFSAKLKAKVYAFFKKIGLISEKISEKIGLVSEKIAERIRTILEFIWDITQISALIIEAVVTKITDVVSQKIQEFAQKIIEKFTIPPPLPLPAAAVMAALVDKIKKAIEVIKRVIAKIELIINKVIVFIKKVIETISYLIERIVEFVKMVIDWIEKSRECLEPLLSLITALTVFVSFCLGGKDTVDANTPPSPPLPAEFYTPILSQIVVSGFYTSGTSAVGDEGYIITWNNLQQQEAEMLSAKNVKYEWREISGTWTEANSDTFYDNYIRKFEQSDTSAISADNSLPIIFTNYSYVYVRALIKDIEPLSAGQGPWVAAVK